MRRVMRHFDKERRASHELDSWRENERGQIKENCPEFIRDDLKSLGMSWNAAGRLTCTIESYVEILSRL